MRAGDVIFVQGKGLIPSLVRFFDNGGRWSHVCIAVSDTHVLETDLFTNSVINEFHFKDYEIIDLGLTDDQRQKVVDIAQTLLGIRYDYLLVIWYMLKGVLHLTTPWHYPRQMICSELVDYVLYMIGVISYEENISSESPNQMYINIKAITTRDKPSLTNVG